MNTDPWLDPDIIVGIYDPLSQHKRRALFQRHRMQT